MTHPEQTSVACGYCGSEALAYELQSDRGQVTRCIPCLAIEQGQQRLRTPFEKFIDFDPGVVYDSEEEVRDSRRNSYEVCRAWWTVLARIQQDEPILERDPEAIGAIHEYTREFLTNIMGAEAHQPPSEVAGAEVSVGQSALGDADE